MLLPLPGVIIRADTVSVFCGSTIISITLFLVYKMIQRNAPYRKALIFSSIISEVTTPSSSPKSAAVLISDSINIRLIKTPETKAFFAIRETA